MKNKTIENATFNTDLWKGKSKEEFMNAHKGIYMKHFKGYPDQEAKAEQQLSDAYDMINPAVKEESKEVTVMDSAPADAAGSKKK